MRPDIIAKQFDNAYELSLKYVLTAFEKPKVACHRLNEEGSSVFAVILTSTKHSKPAVSESESIS